MRQVKKRPISEEKRPTSEEKRPTSEKKRPTWEEKRLTLEGARRRWLSPTPLVPMLREKEKASLGKKKKSH